MAIAPVSDWLSRWAHLIAPGSSVLDVACGTGRHMQWLAEHGHRPLGLDVSQESLSCAAAFGDVLACDLEAGQWPLAERKFAAVVVTNYLHRPLLPILVQSLSANGIFLYETFAQGNERFGRPRNPDFLLRPGELLDACRGLHVVAYEHGLLCSPDRIVQRIAAVNEAALPAVPRNFTFAPLG